MRRHIQLLCWLVVVLLPIVAMAQSWVPVGAQYGPGFGVCDNRNGVQNCLILQCDANRGLKFNFVGPAAREKRTTGILRVDDGKPATISLVASGKPGELKYNHGGFDHGNILLEMTKGQRLTLVLSERFDFPLNGARTAIEQTMTACAGREYARFTSFADLQKKTTEAESRIGPEQTYLSYLHDQLAQGPVLESSQSNSALAGIGREGCIAQCLGRADCLVAAYEDASGQCSLQSDLGPMQTRAGALTTLIETRPLVVRKPQLPGPGPVMAQNLRWVPGEDWQGYVKRLRDAAVPMGQDCQVEANEMGRFASTLKITPPDRGGVAGDTSAFQWTSQRLNQRIPAWIVLSVDRPARFDGDGFYALNGGAIGPFGLGVDAGLQRAFAPVYAETGVDGGKIDVIPLEAGTYTLRATLVSYLRQCQQELPLAQAEFQITVAPAAPRIVLRDITAGHPYDRRIEVPEFNRRIELNDTRFVIQNLEDGSEILAREGKQLRQSPTKRFVSIFDDGFYDVFDIVDGVKVARVWGDMLAFWNADSFLVSDGVPWGQIGMASTLRPRVFVDQYQTGSSCCYNGGNSAMAIDLENNLFRISEQVFSILDGTVLGGSKVNKFAPRNSNSLGGSLSPAAFQTIDLVAPIEVSEKWSTPLGPLFVDGFSYGNIRDPKKPEDVAIMAMATKEVSYPANPDFGKTARKTAQATEVPTIFRGMPGTDGSSNTSGLFNTFTRAGVTLREGVKPLKMLDLPFYTEPKTNDQAAKLQGVMQNALQIESDMAALGKSVRWSKEPDADISVHYCEHFPLLRSGATGADKSLTYYWMNLAYRFDLGDRLVWITREQCSGGATGGTLVDAAGLNIFDSHAPGQTFADYRVEEIITLGTSSLRRVFQTDFQTKLFNDNLLVTYAPGKGALMVFDLSTREFKLKLEYGRRGDLLEDVFVDAQGRHLFQLNSDGSFTIYRLSDAEAILEGRYLDDELVVWTADFQFDATEEGAAFVELRFPGQAGQYSFQQFDGTLRVPGLLQTVLSGGAVKAPRKVGVPPKMQGRLAANGNRITGLALAKGSRPIKAVRLFQDGVLTSSFETSPGQLINVDAPRITGARWATLVTEDVDGLVSLPLNVDLGADPAGLPRTHFLGVGVDYYAETRLEPLNYAKLDALRISDTFAALNGRTVSMVTNTLLTDRRASLQGIPDAIDTLLNAAQSGDHVVLFFAGHGLQDTDGNFYFGLSGTTLDDLPNTALNWLDLSRRFVGKGVRITVLLDACHAGAAGTKAFATNDAAVAGLTAALSGSMTVLSAAKGRQFSGESASVGGGYFTAAIQDVLLGSRTIFDENRNGVLEAVEFYRGVKTRVVEKRGAAQTPWLSRNQLVGEYGLF